MQSCKAFVLILFIVGLSLPASQTYTADLSDCRSALCLNDLIIIGELEQIALEPGDLVLKARIDTGAKTSSLGVAAQRIFEREGKPWIHFTVESPQDGRMVEFVRPLERSVKIKRSEVESIRRFVVKLKFTLANIAMEKEFTLADRSNLEYPVLIGRNTLNGIFVVDVSRRYSTHHHGELEE